MKLDGSPLRVNPRFWIELATEAERLGSESVWVSDHLVLPKALQRRRSLTTDTDRAHDTRLRRLVLSCGQRRTNHDDSVRHLRRPITLRHPRLAARSITTMDVISGGRVEAGVGAGYVRAEWDALGIDRRSSRHGLSHAMPSTAQRLRKTRRVVRHVRMTNGSHEDVASPGDGTDDAGLEAENRAVCATKSKESVLA